MLSVQTEESYKNDKKNENNQENNGEKDTLIRKRTVEDGNETLVENLDEKRPKKDDGKSNHSNDDQNSGHQTKPSFSSFKSLSESSVSPFASLKPRNITFPFNSSSHSAKKTFGSNISGSGFDSLVPSSKNSSEDTNIFCESKALNNSTEIHKKTPNEAFSMLLEKEVDNYTQKDDHVIKKSTAILEQEGN
ncbi:unnamed protein product [Pneumocystis jirovecii]|uniref:Uncharacterized protein n=1 Tax=Pneumocystis jirovecii TaxID=42068 RepID=L0PHT3_PNEJI|nr:unnamed protein product [Pneumocystis jirovecii]